MDDITQNIVATAAARATENAGMEHAGQNVHYWKTPECPFWKAKLHLSICKRSMCVSAVYLSLRIFAFYTAAETLVSESICQPVYTLSSLFNATVFLNSPFLSRVFRSLKFVPFLFQFSGAAFSFLCFRRPLCSGRVCNA